MKGPPPTLSPNALRPGLDAEIRAFQDDLGADLLASALDHGHRLGALLTDHRDPHSPFYRLPDRVPFKALTD